MTPIDPPPAEPTPGPLASPSPSPTVAAPAPVAEALPPAPILAARAPNGPTVDGRCENCGEPLYGGHCYSCGQPTKGLVRHFTSILGDFFDTVLNIDSRVFRTLGPLLFKPGYLSQEYFDGHRVRFVSPVRLFVFLSIVTFLFAQWSTPDLKVGNGKNDGTLNFDFDSSDSRDFGDADTVAEVEQQRKQAIAGIDKAIREGGDVPGLAAGMGSVKLAINEAARERTEELQAEAAQPPKPRRDAEVAKTPAKPAPPSVAGDEDASEDFRFNGKPWDAKSNPLTVDWLPQAGNNALNSLVGRAKDNAKRIRKDPNLFKSAIFSALPTTLFLFVPVFALLLKVLYLFKRRLYMEHLIVALHSHAFLCLAVIVLIALTTIEALAGAPTWLSVPFGLIEFAIGAWMPLYLLLMQKRIYRQGWPMTVIKFGLIGVVYFFMLVTGVTLTMLAAIVWL